MENESALRPPDLPDSVTCEVMVTLDDQLALQMRALASPAMRPRAWQRLRAVLLAALIAPLALAVGALVAWATDRQSLPLATALDVFTDNPSLVIVAVLIMIGAVLLSMARRKLLARSRLRKVLRRIAAARPDVDRSDPQLPFRARVTINDIGVESQSATGTTLIRWIALKLWEEKDGSIMMLGDAMTGLAMPTAAVDPTVLTRFRAILTAHLGPKTDR